MADRPMTATVSVGSTVNRKLLNGEEEDEDGDDDDDDVILTTDAVDK